MLTIRASNRINKGSTLRFPSCSQSSFCYEAIGGNQITSEYLAKNSQNYSKFNPYCKIPSSISNLFAYKKGTYISLVPSRFLFISVSTKISLHSSNVNRPFNFFAFSNFLFPPIDLPNNSNRNV